MVKFNHFIGKSNKVKERFEIISTDQNAGDMGNKNISGT